MTSARFSHLLGRLNFDWTIQGGVAAVERTVNALNIDMGECADPRHTYTTPRRLFERRIAYWEYRFMPPDPYVVVAPADAKALVGSMDETNALFIKEKFFSFTELIGTWKKKWIDTFNGGDFAVFRLTPEKYHHNHVPVSGKVVDYYGVEGDYHSCNPAAVVAAVTPYSQNKRVVTIIDTDVTGGTQVGCVAMIEIVALMIGDIVQCYSSSRYDHPRAIHPGMMLSRGQPKSLFRPGSSVDVLLFEPQRVRFDADRVRNRQRSGISSQFTRGWGRPMVETDVAVWSSIGVRRNQR